jgi:drug/metabolite transporter (DMT)-like permease
MDYGAVPRNAWLGLAYMVAMTSVVMMLTWNVLLRHLGPVEVSICTNAQPPATAALSALLAGLGVLSGHQDLSAPFWMGTALVIAGVVLVQARELVLAHAMIRKRSH